MSTVVIGVTLADAEEFCQRNPDFADAVRKGARSQWNKDGLFVTGVVLTPRARRIQTGERHYVARQFSHYTHELYRCVRGAVSGRGSF